MIVSGCNFLIGVLLARFLGLDQFGVYSLLWLAVLFISSIQLAFVITPLLTFSAKKKGRSFDLFLSNMFFVQIIFAAFLVLLLYVFFKIAPIFDAQWEIGSLLYLMLLVTFGFLIQDFIRRYCIVKLKYSLLLIMDIIAYGGQILIISFFAYFNKLSIENVFIVLFLTFFSSILVGLLKIKFLPARWNYLKILLLKNWEFSKWLVYSAVLQWGSGNYFILAAGSLLGVWAVGVIKIMQNLMGVFHVLFLAFENILPINFAKIFYREGLNNLLSYSKKFILLGLLGFSIIILLAYPFSKDLISLLYGEDKAKYSFLVIWFILIYFLIYIGMIIRYILRTVNKTKIIFYGYIVNLFFSLIFSSYLINYFGITGVAIGMIVIQVIMNLLMFSFIKRSTKFL